MRSVVVLPHPDGPSIAKKEPRSIESVRRSTAVISPKRLVTSSRWMSGDAPPGASGSVIERGAYWASLAAGLVPQTQRTGARFDIPAGVLGRLEPHELAQDLLHDLVGAAADRPEAGVAGHALDAVLAHVARAAVQLQA